MSSNYDIKSNENVGLSHQDVIEMFKHSLAVMRDDQMQRMANFNDLFMSNFDEQCANFLSLVDNKLSVANMYSASAVTTTQSTSNGQTVGPQQFRPLNACITGASVVKVENTAEVSCNGITAQDTIDQRAILSRLSQLEDNNKELLTMMTRIIVTIFPQIVSSINETNRGVKKLCEEVEDVYNKAYDAKAEARECVENTKDLLDKVNKIYKFLDIKGSSRSVAGSYSKSSKDAPDLVLMQEQVAKLGHTLERISKEVRSNNILDLVQDRIIPAIYTIRKVVDGLALSSGIGKKDPSENSAKMDEDDEHQKKLELDVVKIHDAVQEIQEKMDAWLRYSKKMITKSDENTTTVMSRMVAMENFVQGTHDEVVGLASSIKDNELFLEKKEIGIIMENKFGEIYNLLETFMIKNAPHSATLGVIELSEKIISYISENDHRLIKKVRSYMESGDRPITEELKVLKHMILDDLQAALRNVPPKLDDLYIRVLPILEEIRNTQKKLLDRDKLDIREDQDHIQKILDIVEDIKETSTEKSATPASAVPTQVLNSGSNDNSLVQVFNALIELKNKFGCLEQNVTRSNCDLNSDLMKITSKCNELLKLTQKHIIMAEELKKLRLSDNKNISTLNTTMFTLKSGSNLSHNKTSSDLKELKASLSSQTEVITDVLKEKLQPVIESLNQGEKSQNRTKGSNDILEKLIEHTGVCSEIMNSVEDLKQLTSSVPNAIHDLVPKIETILKAIDEMPNDFGSLEENLCANLDIKIKEALENTGCLISSKFDLIELRLSVIKKYIKHGGVAAISGEQTSASSDSLKTVLEELLIVSNELNLMSKAIIKEQAKGIVVEDQLEALCNTILQPINEVKPLVESMSHHLRSITRSLPDTVIENVFQTDKEQTASANDSCPLEELPVALSDDICSGDAADISEEDTGSISGKKRCSSEETSIEAKKLKEQNDASITSKGIEVADSDASSLQNQPCVRIKRYELNTSTSKTAAKNKKK